MTTNKSSEKSEKPRKMVADDMTLKVDPEAFQKMLDTQSYESQQKAKGLPPRLVVSE